MVKISLAKGINWVGVVDWNIRNFHSYVTKRGSTYNAYLIEDEKTALVDTVKHEFSNELISKITQIVAPLKIDYIIVNHVEMDHSSSLPVMAKCAKNATIIASQRGKDAIIEHYGSDFSIETVKTGDQLKLGKRTLQFVEAPMLHWPDSMFTYVVEDRILMSNDAFGQHFASSKRFDDEVEAHVLMEEAKIYYANILMPLASLIARKLEEVTKMGIPIEVIAPSHGIIWRSDPSKIIKAYSDWSSGVSKKRVVIVFDTMWGSTDKMARAIEEGIASQGIDVKLLKLQATNRTEAMTEILDAKAVVVGSPTLNNGMFPTLGSFLTYATGLKPKGKLWGFFGSYGWGGGAVRGMIEMAQKAGFEVHEQSVEVKYVPEQKDLKKCFEFGRQIAMKIKA
ncbi:lactamase [miscellaneous Crenarchaeota group-1 archaeon SG8-32-3]|uniref:Lactamase n=1 Tax=miscellaneous Crenarchaeota group-1 archaeon SG8-32-3 TaxID=1685125 RepID=A0A0M0BRI9_9ARCH|nr:MAG: lactamase [miscellaneous Crenarchaeota group-1 archaeon SG8-32-3]